MKNIKSGQLVLWIIVVFLCGCSQAEVIAPTSTISPFQQIEPTLTLVSPQTIVNKSEGFLYLVRGDNGALVLVDSTLNEVIPISLQTTQYEGASLSPSGEKIAYWFDGVLFVFDIDSEETIKINSDKRGSFQYGQLVWIQDEAQIATDCVPKGGHPISEVCIYDLETGQLSILTNLTAYTKVFYSGVGIGGWASETNQLAFSLEIAPEVSGYNMSIIFVIELDTLQIKPIFDEKSQSTYTQLGIPRISEDGTKIIVDAKVNEQNYEILLIDIQTGSVSQITHTSNGDTKNPFWLDNDTFVASLVVPHGGGYKVTCPIYSFKGEVVDDLYFDGSWYMMDIQRIDLIN